ncbi:MAG: alpha/beta hydrolase [Planctomycetes bacterium]|nr:alpha/beta hydrolase [Planctomycetota bacterium]
MQERYIHLDGEWLFLRHSSIRPDRRTLLFVHGLGESGLCFREAFDRLGSLDCNLLAPDNVGYGRSSAARQGDYSFRTQIVRLTNLVAHLNLRRLTVVGHSLGGILATYWPSTENSMALEGLVNIEGCLTPADTLFSKLAVEAYRGCGGNFEQWCRWFQDEFMEKLISGGPGACWPSHRRYYASLSFCRPKAFLANALEIAEKSRPVEGTSASEIGHLYASIPLRKVYCWGTESLSEPAQGLLKQAGLSNHMIQTPSHWPMVDRPEEFYGFLAEWIAQGASETV